MRTTHKFVKRHRGIGVISPDLTMQLNVSCFDKITNFSIRHNTTPITRTVSNAHGVCMDIIMYMGNRWFKDKIDTSSAYALLNVDPNFETKHYEIEVFALTSPAYVEERLKNDYEDVDFIRFMNDSQYADEVLEQYFMKEVCKLHMEQSFNRLTKIE